MRHYYWTKEPRDGVAVMYSSEADYESLRDVLIADGFVEITREMAVDIESEKMVILAEIRSEDIVEASPETSGILFDTVNCDC